jgi:hypothetical protein
MTADAAVEGIRALIRPARSDSSAPSRIRRIIDRLSKALWKGESVETIWRKTDHQNVTFHSGLTVVALQPDNKQVVDAQGNRYSWDKLLRLRAVRRGAFPSAATTLSTFERWPIIGVSGR